MAGMVSHFEKQTIERLDTIVNIPGPGIYSLFYSGALPVYRPLSGREMPIYVGKAVPPGSRKGDQVDVDSPALQRRLREHTKSINEADNLQKHVSIERLFVPLLGCAPVPVVDYVGGTFFLIDYSSCQRRCRMDDDPALSACLDRLGEGLLAEINRIWRSGLAVAVVEIANPGVGGHTGLVHASSDGRKWETGSDWQVALKPGQRRKLMTPESWQSSAKHR